MKQSGAIFLTNSEGRVLLVHPSGRYNRNAPWMPPKEEIEPGETPLEAARRAIIEELQLPADSYDDVRELDSVTYKTKSKRIWCYAARYLGKDADVRLDWENDRYGWFTSIEAQGIVKEEFAPLLASLMDENQAHGDT